MPNGRDAISDTSPFLYLYRIGRLDWLPQLFTHVSMPSAVRHELEEGQRVGYDVPNVPDYPWLEIRDPLAPLAPALAVSLGLGESAAIALGVENPDRVLLLDDQLARQVARNAGLEVWGTLRLLLEAKSHGLVDRIAPLVDQLAAAGMWMSADIRNRILALAGEP